jgi:hypothetical protein
VTDAEFKKKYGITRAQHKARVAKTRASKGYAAAKAKRQKDVDEGKKHPKGGKKYMAKDMPKGWATKKKDDRSHAKSRTGPGTKKTPDIKKGPKAGGESPTIKPGPKAKSTSSRTTKKRATQRPHAVSRTAPGTKKTPDIKKGPKATASGNRTNPKSDAVYTRGNTLTAKARARREAVAAAKEKEAVYDRRGDPTDKTAARRARVRKAQAERRTEKG